MKEHSRQTAYKVIVIIGGVDHLPGHFEVAHSFLKRMKYPVLFEYGNTLVLRSLRHENKLSIATFHQPDEDCALTTYNLRSDMPDLDNLSELQG